MRAKLAANATLVTLALVGTLVASSLSMLRGNLTQSASQAQAALLEGIAHDLDQALNERLVALELQSAVLGHRVPLGDDGDQRAAALDDFFATRPVFDSLFNDVLLLDVRGVIIHDFPRREGRVGIDLSDRDHVQRAFRDGAALIAEPLASRHSQRPVVNLVVPVRDDTGDTVGLLVGQLKLDDRNVLSDIGRRRQGKSGFFALLGKDDQVIAHPREQILRQQSAIDNPGLARARDGLQPAVVGRNADGDEFLYSYRALTSAPWVVEAVYPASEAYAMLHPSERTLLWLGCALALGAGVLMWVQTRRLLQPLDDLRRAMAEDDAQAACALPRADSAELAALLDAYREQATRRGNAERLMAQSERRLRDLADHIPAMVSYVDRQQRYRYTNARYRHVLGHADTAGMTMLEVLGSERHESLKPHIAQAFAGQSQQFERTFAGPNGSGEVQVDYVPAFDADGKVEGFYVMMIDITARKAAEARVALSERRLRAVTDNMPAMIAYVDRNERYRFLNAHYRRVFGADPGALLGKSVRELMGDAGYAEVKPHVDGALRGERQHFERFGPRVGSDIYAMVDYVPDIAADGSVDGYYVMVLDISARKTAELALAESERRVRAIADSLPALIAHYDREERITFVNAQVGQLHRGTPQSLVGTTLRELRGEETYAVLQPQTVRVLSGEAVTFELDSLVDGEVHHFTATYVPDVDDAGVVQGFYALTLDITDRKRMELSLARSEQRVRTITDNLPAMISHFDHEGRYTFANRSVGRTFGRDPQSLLGHTIRDIRGDAIADVVEPQLALAMTGELAVFETTAPLPGGGLQHFHATYVPEIDQDGEVRGVYALTFDITERKQADLGRVASERRLHDLIDTIPAMVGYFDMAQRCQFANDTALRSLGIERGQVPGIAMRAALGETTWAQYAPYLEDVLSGNRARFEGKLAFRGREAHYQAQLIPDRDASGHQRGYYLMTFDVTAMKEAQQRQARVEAQLRSVTDNLPVLISYIGADGRFTFLNETFNTWMGVAPAAMIGMHVRDAIGETMYAEREPYFRRVFAGERVEFEVSSFTNGVLRDLTTVYVPDIESDGTVAGAFCMSTDVTAMKEAERQLGLLVRSDALTGLANRYRFNEVLPEALARGRRSGMALALMFLDIDRFKQINDRFGHGVGDEALQEFATRLQHSVRLTDLVARLAGDEFVIVLEGLRNAEEPQAIARKILAAMSHPFSLSCGPLVVTTSLGIAYQASTGLGEDGLLARADEALYQAKAAGRNTYRLLVGA